MDHPAPTTVLNSHSKLLTHGPPTTYHMPPTHRLLLTFLPQAVEANIVDIVNRYSLVGGELKLPKVRALSGKTPTSPPPLDKSPPPSDKSLM